MSTDEPQTPVLPPNAPNIGRWLDGVAALADRYDGFIVDQFGVLHDGQRPYAGAAEALARLRAAGQRVIVLSNSGKRADANVQRMARMGFSAEHYDELLTSGELAWELLHRRDRAPFDHWGRRVLPCHAADDLATLEGLDLQPVAGVQDADFVLLASLPAEQPAQALGPLLAQARARGLPLLCTNPDRHRLTPRGVEPSAGSLAAAYAAAGGAVTWLGKPHGLIYEACRERMARWQAARLLAVGDSLEHDIGGAAAAGLDGCYVAAGLHAERYAALGCRTDQLTPWTAAQRLQAEQLLQRLCAEIEGGPAASPDWALPSLRW